MSETKRMARALKDDAAIDRIQRAGTETGRFPSQSPNLSNPPKSAHAFWAVGLNFDYDVLYCEESDSTEWGSMDGPFKTLGEAKRRIRQWISGDRGELTLQLANLNCLTSKQLKRGKS